MRYKHPPIMQLLMRSINRPKKGKLSLEHEEYCNEEFDFELEDEL